MYSRGVTLRKWARTCGVDRGRDWQDLRWRRRTGAEIESRMCSLTHLPVAHKTSLTSCCYYQCTSWTSRKTPCLKLSSDCDWLMFLHWSKYVIDEQGQSSFSHSELVDFQTCKAFASLRETHLKHAFDLLRLVHKYALGSETLDIRPTGAEVRRKLALPHKLEEAMISGSLSENSFQRYETTVTNEDVYNTSLFPGGGWLVTVSGNRQPDAIESSLPSHIPAMKYRIWDLQKSGTDLLLSPVACVTMPPDESEISGEI